MLKYHQKNVVCEKKFIKPKILLKKEFLDQYENCSKEQLLYELAYTRGAYHALKENPQTINNNQFNIFFPKEFGKEEVDYILNKLPNLFHDAITKYCERKLGYLTEQVHCNKKVFPEYANAYISTYKSPFALISDGEKFVRKPKNQVIDQLIEKFLSMLQTYIDDNCEKYGQKILDKFERYRNSIEINHSGKKTPLRKDLEIEIAGLLLDIKPVIEDHLKEVLTRNLI